MSVLKAKMHQIRFPLGLHSRPRWGVYTGLPDLLAVFNGLGLLLRSGQQEWPIGGRKRKKWYGTEMESYLDHCLFQ